MFHIYWHQEYNIYSYNTPLTENKAGTYTNVVLYVQSRLTTNASRLPKVTWVLLIF